MHKLISQLQRLYFLPEQAGPAGEALTPAIVAASLADGRELQFNPLAADGMVRTLLVYIARPGNWEALAALYQALQEELDLPAPAISVSAASGFRLWLSLAQPIPVAQARQFLVAVRRRYLVDLPPASLELVPDIEPTTISLVPALNPLTGKWSAFIDPGLGSMFSDESGLEMAPNMDRQADLLAGLKSIAEADFQRALAQLEADEAGPPPATAAGASAGQRPTLNVGSDYRDPQSFLLAVMNDPSAAVEHRIEAAKALLPYFAQHRE